MQFTVTSVSKTDTVTLYTISANSGGRFSFIHATGDQYIVPQEEIPTGGPWLGSLSNEVAEVLKNVLRYTDSFFDKLSVTESLTYAAYPIVRETGDIIPVVLASASVSQLSEFGHKQIRQAPKTVRNILKEKLGACSSNLENLFKRALLYGANEKMIGFDVASLQALPFLKSLPIQKIELLSPSAIFNVGKKLDRSVHYLESDIRELFEVSDDNYCLLINELEGEFVDVVGMLFEYGAPINIPQTMVTAFPEGLKGPRSWKTGKEFHDKVAMDYTKIKNSAGSRMIRHSKKIQKLSGTKVSDLTIRLPESTLDLAVWGKLLSNCIAGYGDRAVTGSCILLGLYDGDTLKYAAELSPSTLDIVQLKGNRNADAPDGVKKSLKAALVSIDQAA